MKKILIIAAHPDDEVLGCGGAMARFVKEGNEVYTLILGEGVTARYEERNEGENTKELKALKEEMDKANQKLGTKKVYSFDFPDNRFDTVPLLDIVKAIEKIKLEIKPQVVFTHHHGDLNIDHGITLKAVMTAARPVEGELIKEIYSFEVPSSTEWNVPSSSTTFIPNCFIDISKTLDTKIKAMEEYKSEIREYPHPRSSGAIEIIAKRWGIQVGHEAVEAFEVIRFVK